MQDEMRRAAVALLLCAGTVGCSTIGPTAMIAPRPPTEYQSLGPTKGHDCSWWARHLRFERAYADALAKVPGAKRLVQVELREGWHWRGVGFAWCAAVRGEAIK